MFKTRILYLLLILVSIGVAASAQGRKKAVKVKAAEVKVDVPTPADLLYADMLSSTERVLFIDSLVVDKSNMLSGIPLNKESGRVGLYDAFMNTSGNPSSCFYVNEFGNKMFYSMTDKNGRSRLYSADKLNGQWTNHQPLAGLGDEYEDINYPFMMPDGVTLYFSAKSADGLGGRDIYVTMYDADSARFYKPENIGLPYNSKSNDYYCIIDDYDAIGWLVTDRHQPEGKVCVYTFAPSSSREVYDEDAIGEDKLRSLAEVRSIKDSWTDKAKLNAARERLAQLSRRKELSGSASIAFVVNDNTVYTRLEDFKLATSKERFGKLEAMRKAAKDIEDKLEAARETYVKGTSSDRRKLSGTILELEKRLEETRLSVRLLEKEIRNAENLAIKKQ